MTSRLHVPGKSGARCPCPAHAGRAGQPIQGLARGRDTWKPPAERRRQRPPGRALPRSTQQPVAPFPRGSPLQGPASHSSGLWPEHGGHWPPCSACSLQSHQGTPRTEVRLPTSGSAPVPRSSGRTAQLRPQGCRPAGRRAHRAGAEPLRGGGRKGTLWPRSQGPGICTWSVPGGVAPPAGLGRGGHSCLPLETLPHETRVETALQGGLLADSTGEERRGDGV